MKRILFLSSVVSCLLALRPAIAREWTDSSGTHKVEAELVKLDGEVVHLKKNDGAIVKIPLNKLCEEDRKFVREQTAAPAPPVNVIKILPGQVVAPSDALVKSATGTIGQRDAAELTTLTEKLGLDADQQAKIKAINEKGAEKMKELLGKGQWNPATYHDWTKAKNDEINAVLTPDQQEKLKALRSPANVRRSQRPLGMPSRGNAGGNPASGKPAVPEGVRVSIDAISNTHYSTTGKVVFYTRVRLKVIGTGLAEAKAMRTVLKEAKDDADASLLPNEKPSRNLFMAFMETPWQRGPATVRDVNLTLAPPDNGKLSEQGQVKTVKILAGSIELVVPTKDPASIITASWAKDAGVPLKNETLKAAGAEITLKELRGVPKDADPPKSWEVVYEIKDPKGKVVGNPEFFDGSGRKLKTDGINGGGAGGNVTMTAMFKSKPPEDFVVKFYLITDKSVVSVPFEFKDVPVAQSP